jgi:hypothetical protein
MLPPHPTITGCPQAVSQKHEAGFPRPVHSEIFHHTHSVISITDEQLNPCDNDWLTGKAGALSSSKSEKRSPVLFDKPSCSASGSEPNAQKHKAFPNRPKTGI